jgi:hypothetical protein
MEFQVLREGIADNNRLPRALRQSDISRAIRGVKAAGVPVGKIEIDQAGRIVITSGSAVGEHEDPYEVWKASRNAR